MAEDPGASTAGARGALGGIANWIRGFQRAMFGKMEPFPLSFRTPTYTLAALLVLWSLVIINATILAVAAAPAYIAHALHFDPQNTYGPLTAAASIVCVVAITFGLVLFLGEMSRPSANGVLRTVLCWSCWFGFIVTVVAIIAVAVTMSLITWKICVPAWLTAAQQDLRTLSTILVLASLALALLSLLVRWLIRSGGGAPEDSAFLDVMFYFAFLMYLAAFAGVVFLLVAHTCNPGRPAWTTGWLSSSRWVWPFLVAISARVR